MKKSLMFGATLALVGTIGSTVACTTEVADEDIGTTSEPLDIHPVADPNGNPMYGVMYTFPNNQTSKVRITNSNVKSCFLSSVWGKFQSAFDYVLVSKDATGWYITGNRSGVNGTPSGDAFCTNATAGPEVTASFGTAVLKDPNGNDAGPGNLCFLTGIRGDFTTATTNPVRVTFDADQKWRLTVSVSKRAYARCIIANKYTEVSTTIPTSVWMPGAGGTPATNNFNDRQYFCALTGISGALRGAWVGTFIQGWQTQPQSWRWLLGGGNSNEGQTLKGYARCGA